MCTAISWKADSHYFGRNLDLEGSYGEYIAVVPRNMPLRFHSGEISNVHYALIGTAHVSGDYPLFYDAVNENGVCFAGLNFPGNACYEGGDESIACYEIALYLLAKCRTAREACDLLAEKGISGAAFREDMPATPLHFMIADEKDCFVIEPMKGGIRIHQNPLGVLTNNPPFEFQMMNLNNYLNLTTKEPENRFSSEAGLKAYSRGMGAMGLPGDFSSQSRFVKAAFVKYNSPVSESAEENIMQFFHMLDSVAMPMGSVVLENGALDRTIYSCCFDADKGVYYYKTYENSLLHAVDMHLEDIDSDKLTAYPMEHRLNIIMQNNNPRA